MGDGVGGEREQEEGATEEHARGEGEESEFWGTLIFANFSERRPSPNRRRPRLGLGLAVRGLGGFFVKRAGFVVGVEGRALGVAAGENGEDRREDEEGGEGAEGEAAEDGAAERGDLIAAFAETEGEG